MDGKQLKNSILQWAIQGKLVPQNPKDESAQKLLEKIALSRHSERSEESSKRSKKASTSLRGAKATKQSKNPTSRIYRENGIWYEQVGNAEPKDISEDIPFEIPENWAWCRLENVCIDIADIDHKMPAVCENGIPYISPLNFRPNNKIDYAGAKKISKEDFIQLSKKCKPERGDIIFPRYGTIGVIRIVESDIDFLVSYSCATIKPCKGFMDVGYISALLQSSLIQKVEIPRYINKTTQPNVGLQSIKKFLFALPPLAEQKRIVAKLEQVLPLADEYGAAQEQLDKLNKELPEALKKSILQQAIQGKLVPQNPKDEPAQKLLERIAAARSETTQLKGAKSKKSAPTSCIYCENGTWYEQIGNAEPKDISEDIPFEIPENWTWCRWGDLSDSIQYGYNAPALESGRIKMVRISDIHDNKIEWDNVPYCQIKETEIPTYLLKKNDILFARTGGTVGKSYLVGDVPTEAVYAGYLIRTRYNAELLNPQYLKFFMESSLYWEQLHEGTIATAQPNCNGKTLGKMLLPLPPLAEQKRIVTKLEQLFKVL